MTTLREAAQQALEALKDPWKAGPEGVANAITALRAALEQPEQEPCDIAEDGVCEALECCGDPPRREWRGLSDKEIGDAFNATNDYNAFARAIEQALKERNV